MKPKLILIRGLSGSGKSTMARQMHGFAHFEADMFLHVDGKYVYDATKVRAAHDWCVASAKQRLEDGESVVVSNTFAKSWELKRYVDLGFPFEIIEATGKWPNTHGVPEQAIAAMAARWEPLSEVLAKFSPLKNQMRAAPAMMQG